MHNGALKVSFREDNTVGRMSFGDCDQLDVVDFGEYRIIDDREHYTGPVIVEPSAFGPTVLETRDKVMDDNVTVKKIYSAAVSNPSGGNTFYIASSLEE